MDVKFTTTTSAKLNTLPIEDGQIIALSDRPGYYYDMGSARHKVSSEYVYRCNGSSEDRDNIINILSTFSASVSSGINSMHLKIEGTYVRQLTSGSEISFTVPQGCILYLDFTNANVSGSGSIPFISANCHGDLHIAGLAPITSSAIIKATGTGRLFVEDCVFGRTAGAIVGISSAISTTVTDCTFDLSTTLSPGIALTSDSPVASISDCNFISTATSTEGKAIQITSADKSKVQIHHNYLPADSVTAGGVVIDVSFTNICP